MILTNGLNELYLTITDFTNMMASSRSVPSFGICAVLSSHALGVFEMMFGLVCASSGYLYVFSADPSKTTLLPSIFTSVSILVYVGSVTVAYSENLLSPLAGYLPHFLYLVQVSITKCLNNIRWPDGSVILLPDAIFCSSVLVY